MKSKLKGQEDDRSDPGKSAKALQSQGEGHFKNVEQFEDLPHSKKVV